MVPEVSIIIPNYNHEWFLAKRIESCLNQTFRDFEIIILDDCSADNSRAIIEKYRQNDKVSRIIFNEANSGSTFLQWKKGLSAAAGRYIWIAESDDCADVNLLQVLIEPFKKFPDVVISYCRSAYIDENDLLLGITLHADELDPVRWTKDYVETGEREIDKYLNYRNTIPNASAVLFKKPADIDAKLDTSMRFCGDWLFWKNMLKGQGRIAYSHRVLNMFRVHPATTRFLTSATTRERELKRFREYRQLVPTLYFNPLDNRCRWMMEEWIHRGGIFKNTFYRFVPLLHPALVVRYYLYLLKKLVLPKTE